MRKLLPLLVLLLWMAACQRPQPEVTIVVTMAPIAIAPDSMANPVFADGVGVMPTSAATPLPGAPQPSYAGTPTPDPIRPSAAETAVSQTHIVSFGESLGSIAQAYGTTIEALMENNGLESADALLAGQALVVPAGSGQVAPSFKLIPDSELVYGPRANGFDVATAVGRFNGYLMGYRETVEGASLTGPQVVQLVADRFSVNPRLLLAALEHRAGWVTGSVVADTVYPMGRVAAGYEGLYQQLSWAANKMNLGYYGRAEGGVTGFSLTDGTRLTFAPDINDGTAGVQLWLGAHDGATYDGWLQEAGSDGFFAVFSRLFGNPFAYTYDPLWPVGLAQPPLALPWSSGETWYFTGGPHGGWAAGSAWAALDFVDDYDQLGCYNSDAWVTSMADGVVSRSDFGAVVVDLDGDGFAGTGWALIYMHLATRDRIPAGTRVSVGDRLGHPSCEGGFSNGTHVHIARTFNGRWVSADGAMPFVLGGWTSRGYGLEYEGALVRGDAVQEACECREDGNAIRHE